MNTFGIMDDEKIKVVESDCMKAQSQGISLSSYLNNKYAKEVNEFNKNHNSELDAFDIALLSNGIIVRDNYEKGIQSSPMSLFFTTDENKILFPEFIVRQLRQIQGMPSILNEIVGTTRTITGDTMRQVVLDLSDTPQGKANKKSLKERRISEGADIPVATLKLGETAIKIYKYGIGIKTTYEVLRRTTIDMFRKQMELVTVQASYDEVGAVIETIINGDGNTNAAKVYKAKDLNPDAVAGKLDEVTLIKFLIEQAPFNYDTLLVDKDIYTQISTILLDKNMTNAINPKVSFEFPQGLLSNIKVIYSQDVGLTKDGNHQIIGLAKQYAIEKDVEANSAINEITKVAANQTESAYITENAGFSKIDSRASAILELA